MSKQVFLAALCGFLSLSTWAAPPVARIEPDDHWKGSNRQDILDAERALGLKQDGKMSPALKKAIIAFQQKNSLPLTGWLDTSTMEWLTDHDMNYDMNYAAPQTRSSKSTEIETPKNL